MGLIWSSYYQFARVNGGGPDLKNWAVTDSNWQLASLLFKRSEQHHHNASTPMNYPGYNLVNPATPATPLLTIAPTGGSISAGTSLGVRLSFVDQYGLETQGSPEVSMTTAALPSRPNSPITTGPVTTPVAGAVNGGTFVYVITKGLVTGETAISDVTTVSIPFNTTGTTSYTVPFTFTPISSYTDNTDSLYLYRSTGYDANFVLLSMFTATPGGGYNGQGVGFQNNVSTYTDNGTVYDASHQPPQASTFGKQNLLTINWATLQIPTTAYYFNVYVTQQTGIWGTQNLLFSYPLVNPATPFPTNINYLGTETLSIGYPLDFTQIPYGASLINLTNEAIGAPIYTTTANAGGWQTYNFVFPTNQTHATPMFGAAYVDDSIGGNGQLKVCLATPSGPNNPGIFTTLAGVGSGYAHPLAESGGHTASHIYAAPTGIGGPTQDLINNIVATPVAGPSQYYRKQVTNIYKVTATPADIVQSTVGQWTQMADMTTTAQWPTGISPSFTGQWFEAEFQTFTELQATTNAGNIITAVLTINGQQVYETMCPIGGIHATPTGLLYGQLNFTYATPLTRSNNTFGVQWMLSQPGYALSYGGNVVGQAPRRMFVINERF